MVSSELIEIMETQGRCMTGFGVFLEHCDTLADLENLDRLFQAYVNAQASGGWGNVLREQMLAVGVRLMAGEDLEQDEDLKPGHLPDTPAFNVASQLKRVLLWPGISNLEFLAGLLKSINDGRDNEPAISPREAVAQYLKSLDAPKPASSQRAPRRAKGGHRKAA